MPRIKEDTTRLITFRVSERLAKRYAETVKREEQTMSADFRRYMQARVKQAERREREAA